ncbi:pro-sigmaK processing inhibitor BofA family protein [Eubacterium multiforme]|uniref:Inhibitor of the pro-sigma K processing machinery n=1 Tax=Eubacterium multiforme TaxID=83339 RepID=A0ABT9UVI3_9FIRM|nr:pro-sigmaK processing inhibitor BofA family protein [Eubacterium multiforme]MDQ0150337.1 inhibitor of the pro-sigma K processing machinery [Eubacterium multiforme]
MDMELIIYGAIGLVVLYVLITLLKWPIKLLINGLMGVVLLYIVNLIGGALGFHIAINIITALIAGIFGIPGVAALILFQLFL